MKIYKVGGCVRDMLLGIAPKDTDYVVVGATPQQMIDLGFEKVGASFPVFLKNGEEYALARTERKTGVGYNGFDVTYDPTVTLEDDLIRRDLTINAMAIDPDTGAVIDPYGGQADLHNRVLRHVSDAFAEDPIRVLRTARFAARYGYDVDPSTIDLMRRVAPELDHVPRERIWTEFEKGLMEDHPDRMLHVLHECDAFSVESMRPYGMSLAVATQRLNRIEASDSLPIRFAAIADRFTSTDYELWCIPRECSRLAAAATWNSTWFAMYDQLSAEERVKLLTQVRAYSDYAFVINLARAAAIRTCRPSVAEQMLRDLERSTINAEAVAANCTDRSQIKQAIFNTRVSVLLACEK